MKKVDILNTVSDNYKKRDNNNNNNNNIIIFEQSRNKKNYNYDISSVMKKC